MKELAVGSWWRSTRARGQLFCCRGQTPDGAYRFTKYNESDRQTAVSEIEIYNLDSMEPVDESSLRLEGREAL